MQDKMLSLFDYLGHAAGKELGKQVAEYAIIRKAKYNTRPISNPAFTGVVMLYEKSFLNEFFRIKNIFTDNTDYTEINTQLAEEAFNDTNKVY